MPLQFRCSGCQGFIQIPEEHAGKNVRCPKCKAVVKATAATPPKAATPTAATPPAPAAAKLATPAKPPAATTPPAAAKPATLATPAKPTPPTAANSLPTSYFSPEAVATDFGNGDAEELPSVLPITDEEAADLRAAAAARPTPEPLFPETKRRRRPREDEEEDRPRRRAPQKSSALPMLALLIGGGVLAFFLVVAFIVVTAFFLFSAGSRNLGRPVAVQNPGNPLPKGQQPPRPNFQGQPAGVELPVQVVFDKKGHFTTQVDFHPESAPPEQVQFVRRYQIPAKSGAFYRLQLKENPQVHLNMMTMNPNNVFGNNPAEGIAFRSDVSSACIVMLRCNRDQARTCQLSIQEIIPPTQPIQLDTGKFEKMIDFEKDGLPPPLNFVKKFEMTTKDKTIYTIEIKDNPAVRVHLTDPRGVPEPLQPQPQGGLIFLADPGIHVVTLECNRDRAKPFQVSICEFQPEPPLQVKLDQGKYETQVTFDPKSAPLPNLPLYRRYQFDAKADTVYWIETKENVRVRMQVENLKGLLKPQEQPSNRRSELSTVILAQKAGPCVIKIECDRLLNTNPCKLTIREMDGTQPLPSSLRLPHGNVDLPQLTAVQTLNVYEKQLSGAAFAPDGKHFWMAHGDNTLSYREQPGSVKVGSYKMPHWLFALGVDKQGRLYGQTSKNTNGPLSVVQRTASDIRVWENLKPEQENIPLPEPSKTIPLGGVVQRFISSPDGKWLYFLDTHNRKLGRIDTTTATIDQQIDKLSPGTKSFCMTADGKKIYCCSEHNRIDIIDTEPFQLTKSVRLNKGQPRDIAASNAGLLFLVGKKVGEQPFDRFTCMLVDLTKDIPEEANIIPLPIGHYCQFVVLLPDQRAALFSGDRRVTVCSPPDRPALFQAATHEQQIRDYFMPGQLVVSPDSRTVLHDTGVILSISR